MKEIYRFLLVVFLLIVFVLSVDAQRMEKPWEFKINVGYNIGGTSPLPMPEEVRKIEKYSPPAFAPHVALEATHWFNQKWGLTAQLTLDFKGFSVKDSVLNLWTEMEMRDDPYSGTFTGHNETKIKNTYLTLPVMASYKISEKWLLQAGFYVAWLYSPDFKGTASDGYIRQGGPTGDKTLVDEATFDFSENEKKFDCGIQAAAEWKFSGSFALRGQLAWGLTPIFPSDFTGVSFKMYNIYGTIGLSYFLKSF